MTKIIKKLLSVASHSFSRYPFSMCFLSSQNSRFTKILSVCLTFLLFSAPSHASTLLAAVQFINEGPITSAQGYAQISWEVTDEDRQRFTGWEFLLETSQSPTFDNPTVLYRGNDRATFVSGLDNGSYYYRVRLQGDDAISAWSETLIVDVAHYSMAFALSLFILGLATFIAIFSVIFIGNRKMLRESEAL